MEMVISLLEYLIAAMVKRIESKLLMDIDMVAIVVSSAQSSFWSNDSCLDKNHHLFFDNFSSTAKLFQYLEKRVSYASGTIRKDGGVFPVSLIQTFSTVKQGIFHVDYLLVVHWKDK